MLSLTLELSHVNRCLLTESWSFSFPWGLCVALPIYYATGSRMKGARMLDHRLPAPGFLLMSLCIFVFLLYQCISSYVYVFLFVLVTALIDLASDVAFHTPLEAAHKMTMSCTSWKCIPEASLFESYHDVILCYYVERDRLPIRVPFRHLRAHRRAHRALLDTGDVHNVTASRGRRSPKRVCAQLHTMRSLQTTISFWKMLEPASLGPPFPTSNRRGKDRDRDRDLDHLSSVTRPVVSM